MLENSDNFELTNDSVVLVLHNKDDDLSLINEELGTIQYNLNFQLLDEFDFDNISNEIILIFITYFSDSELVKSTVEKLNEVAGDIAVIFSIKLEELESYSELLAYRYNDYSVFPYNRLMILKRVKSYIDFVKYKYRYLKESSHYQILNNEKNELLAIAAHDLKNPIFSIQLLAKMIRDDLGLTRVELAEFSNDIVTSSDRVIDIIKQLLDLNSIDSGKLSVTIDKVNVTEAINHIIELYKYKADKKRIALITEISSDGNALTDLNAVKNIFDNFLSNAIKYSPFMRNVLIRLSDVDNRVLIEVIDEGPGIPQKEQDKLFVRFAKISNKPTGDEHSTGLGLSIVKKFAELIDGELSFKNNDNGVGSTFSVSLPKF